MDCKRLARLALALSACALAACGGGGEEAPTASETFDAQAPAPAAPPPRVVDSLEASGVQARHNPQIIQGGVL